MSDTKSATMIEFCKFSQEEIDEAIEALDTLQRIMVPWFIKKNFGGMGEEDAAQCSKHLMMGKAALILMAEGLSLMKQEDKS
jgi:hypothetical protein